MKNPKRLIVSVKRENNNNHHLDRKGGRGELRGGGGGCGFPSKPQPGDLNLI